MLLGSQARGEAGGTPRGDIYTGPPPLRNATSWRISIFKAYKR
ncbi:hypothetical protein FHX12_002177 [Rhizobium sp. BK609]|jgi:hypothetical protein|nr:hypothetical protein [Rhizobium sp. BK098]MBB3615196.1 hypothetical protein [Rhizobium sp. BK609]MBB3680856.1 hypothetical protein [Rhizobium sp. BK612]